MERERGRGRGREKKRKVEKKKEGKGEEEKEWKVKGCAILIQNSQCLNKMDWLFCFSLVHVLISYIVGLFRLDVTLNARVVNFSILFLTL